MKRIKVAETHQIHDVHDSSKEATELAKQGPKFP
jgi:hypothetical protein